MTLRLAGACHDRALLHTLTLGAALLATAAAPKSLAHPWTSPATWSLSGGYETDTTNTHGAAADAIWSPDSRFALAATAGTLHSSAKEGSFTARTGAVWIDWSPLPYLTATTGYSVWNDRATYKKETYSGALYAGTEIARIGFVAESASSDAKAEDVVLGGRRTQLAFTGMGYGLDGWVTLDRFNLYGSYIGYHYGHEVDQLLAFLTDPNLIQRPKLPTLVNSGLTTAGALLHRSVVLGTDFFEGESRIGLSWSQYHELVTDTRTNVLRAEYEWPVSKAWTAQLNAGASQTEHFGTTWFGGVRAAFYSH